MAQAADAGSIPASSTEGDVPRECLTSRIADSAALAMRWSRYGHGEAAFKTLHTDGRWSQG